MTHGLTDANIEEISRVLRPFFPPIEKIALFGSRATGTYKPYSDIDLVLYGNIDDALVNRLWTLFDESHLPVKVDLHAYDLIQYPPLKAHIDAVAVNLTLG
ncbi:MAG: nucleotidyltransferase domain-containing protein [Vampirovibrionales bacterium]|jgi:predicted nucleotidyltransferase